MAVKHLAITRKVLPGKEAEFEAALREFARESLHEPGMIGIHLLGPVSQSEVSEYGILRSFESEAACDAFYKSQRFIDWQQRVASLAADDYQVRELHGLEAFFQNSGPGRPPRWKMAFVTWLGVFPAVLLWGLLLSPVVGNWHITLRTGFVTAIVVVTLTWGVMPMLTTLFSGWLNRDSVKR